MERLDFYAYRRRLPHWRARGATYFCGWRLLPSNMRLSPEERYLVLAALRHFEGTRYILGPHVVMDDHVHLLATPVEPHPLTDILHSWKSFTANKLQRRHRRRGSVWQEESYSHIIRDDGEYAEKAQYTLNNPWKRWPELLDYPWVAINAMGDFPGRRE